MSISCLKLESKSMENRNLKKYKIMEKKLMVEHTKRAIVNWSNYRYNRYIYDIKENQKSFAY